MPVAEITDFSHEKTTEQQQNQLYQKLSNATFNGRRSWNGNRQIADETL